MSELVPTSMPMSRPVVGSASGDLTSQGFRCAFHLTMTEGNMLFHRNTEGMPTHRDTAFAEQLQFPPVELCARADCLNRKLLKRG
jgi:hypothetical protein